MLFIKQTLWNSYLKILVEPHYKRNDDQFAKYSQTLRNHRLQKVFCWWLSEWHFGLLTVKFLLNQITTHKMASFENIVTRLRIIVLCYSYCAYHQAPVVLTLDSAIPRINHYPADKYYGNQLRPPLDSDLSGGLPYPTFEQPRPERHFWALTVKIVP